MTLTKDELLQETTKTKEIKLECLNNETIKIRKLTHQEITEIQAIYAQGVGTIKRIETPKGIEKITTIDPIIQNKSTNKAILTTIQYSLNLPEEDNWTLEEIQSLPTELINEIHTHILEFNNLKIRQVIEEI